MISNQIQVKRTGELDQANSNLAGALDQADSNLAGQFDRLRRRRLLKPLVLILPLFLYLLLTFALPIAFLLFKAVENTELRETMPLLSEKIAGWDGKMMPPPSKIVKALAEDVLLAYREKKLGKAAKRLNLVIPRFRSMLFKTARKMPSPNDPDLFNKLVKIDYRWGKRDSWVAIRQAAEKYTLFYLLKAIDREYNIDGQIVRVSAEESIYLLLLRRTVWISLVVTLLCLIMGYPVANVLASSNPKVRSLLILLLLVPFWTSLLVRTAAWMVLLQDKGLINQFFLSISLIEEPMKLFRTRLGVYIAMTYVLLPFMVFPILSVMQRISPMYMQAAASLGAKPLRAFLKVYLPQTLPGVGSGVILVFIISLGYYITPSLVGGPTDQMISYYIAFNANTTVNWGLASTLSIMLLLCVVLFMIIFSRFIRIDQIGTR